VASDPLRVQLEAGTQVLKHTILKETRSVNGVRAECSSHQPHVITVVFDFLDPTDGVTIEVLHSGPRKELRVAGTIKGIPKGITNHGRALWFAARRHHGTPFPFNRPKLMFGIVLLLGIGLALAGLFRPQIAAAFPALFKPPEPDRLARLTGWLSSLVYPIPHFRRSCYGADVGGTLALSSHPTQRKRKPRNPEPPPNPRGQPTGRTGPSSVWTAPSARS